MLKRILVVSVIFFGLVSFFLWKFVTDSCFLIDCVPRRNFSFSELNIPASYYPPGTEVYPLHYAEDYKSSNFLLTSSYWDDHISVYSVYTYNTLKKAMSSYEFYSRDNLFNNQYSASHGVDEILIYKSLIADKYSIKCGEFTPGDYRCIYVALFEEFVIEFISFVELEDNEDNMGPKRFIAILNHIENQMSLILQRP